MAITRTAWVDDDGTGTTGTVINNAVKTELYNQIDATVSAVNDASLVTTDITTNNVSITKHGFAPKAPNDVTKFLNGAGAYTQPSALATLVADLLFTDATYDIGKVGATRPRDVFASRNATIGGTLGVTGAATLSSTLGVTGAATLSSTLGVTGLATLSAGLLPGSSPSGIYSSSVTILSASDVIFAQPGSTIFAWMTDNTVGGYCFCVYLNTTSITILNQAGAAVWVTTAPAAGEIQLKDGAAKLSLRAGTTRNNDSVRGVFFVL